MGVQTTVVFTDLFGSTGVFESLGNAKATEAVTHVTAWVAQKCTSHGGKVIKFLGDGVLAIFDDSVKAIAAVIDLQRSYQQQWTQMPHNTYLPLRIGVVRGEVEIVDNDCYGDAVNTASRLSELTGPNQIWVNDKAIEVGFQRPERRFRYLGPIHIRGRAEPCKVYQIEWQEDVNSEFFTQIAGFDPSTDLNMTDALGGQVELSWIDTHKTFRAFELPIHIGRTRQAEFVVNDARVSRAHARLEWRNGSVVFVDISSYGSWVRFSGGGADLQLRREECVLHGRGEISLGTPFTDLSAPVITFAVL
jgi:class 3 adenylate cyclase